MKRKFKYILIGFLFACPFSEVVSQDVYGYYHDALLFSQTNLGGSARTMGMGGVQIGLGGDISSALSNPAGLGFFNRSEFSITPSLNFHNTTTNYLNSTTDGFDTRLGLNNLSLVINKSKSGTGSWRGGSFGISFSRINTFNNEFRYRAESAPDEFLPSSIIDYFVVGSTGILPEEMGTAGIIGLAYKTGLIGLMLNETDVYGTDIQDYPFVQEEVVSTRGVQNQWSFSYGGNFSDMLYIGAGIGFTSVEYRNEKTLEESFEGKLTYLSAYEDFKVNGAGINATIGAIYRPNETFRFGASIITPTFYRLKDTSTSSLFSTYVDPNEEVYDESVLMDIDYNLQTPTRINFGAAMFFGKKGFISGDVELVNYSSNKLKSVNRDDTFEGDNSVIKEVYRGVANLKLGGEYRLDIFRFRAGGGYFADPYKAFNDVNRDMMSFSVGAGIKLPNFYVDLAVVNSRFKSTYLPYDIGTNPIADISNARTNAILTLGFNF